MGGSSYDRDVYASSSSTGFSGGSTSSRAAKTAMGSHKATLDAKKNVKSDKESPVIVCLDGTGSNIEFARIVYDKAPMFHGQIEQQGYLKDFDIAYSICGDAYCDMHPLQIAEPAYGDECEKQLKKLSLEGGGGGQTMETYELAAYYYARHFEMPNAKKPFIFFIADEAPYPNVSPKLIKEQCGDEVEEPISSKDIFKELDKKFHGNVFCLLNPYCGDPHSHENDSIRKAWLKVLPPERVISIVKDGEKGVVDIILGVISVVSHARDLDEYMKDMDDRDQTEERKKQVKDSLKPLTTAIVPVASGTGSVEIFNKGGKKNSLVKF